MCRDAYRHPAADAITKNSAFLFGATYLDSDPSLKLLLLDFMSKITFRNSFVELLTSTNHSGENEENSKMILFMGGWMRAFRISPDVVLEHGELGHRATYVGKFSNHSETKEEKSEQSA